MACPSWLGSVVSVLAALLCLSGCGPLQKGEYWKGSYAHIDHPRYRFDVPEGWREVKAADFALLGFNRRAVAGLDDAGRKVFFEQADLQIQALDTGLISERGAWNRVLRMRFRSDEARGSLHWTVLGLYTRDDTVSLAHLGTPENRDEGMAGLETIAATLRFD